MHSINVHEIMREIEARAAEAGREPEFPQLQIEQLRPVLHEHRMVEPRPLLIGRTRYERVWVGINTLLRRVAAHAVEPAVAQQNEFNAALHDSLALLIDSDAKVRAAVIALRAEQHTPPEPRDA